MSYLNDNLSSAFFGYLYIYIFVSQMTAVLGNSLLDLFLLGFLTKIFFSFSESIFRLLFYALVHLWWRDQGSRLVSIYDQCTAKLKFFYRYCLPIYFKNEIRFSNLFLVSVIAYFGSMKIVVFHYRFLPSVL